MKERKEYCGEEGSKINTKKGKKKRIEGREKDKRKKN